MLSESGALTCMATHTNQNGTVQRRAARWVVSDYSKTSIVTSMLHILARLEKSTIKEGRCQTYTYMYVQDHSDYYSSTHSFTFQQIQNTKNVYKYIFFLPFYCSPMEQTARQWCLTSRCCVDYFKLEMGKLNHLAGLNYANAFCFFVFFKIVNTIFVILYLH